jgi:GT2 family glycosyltransferase
MIVNISIIIPLYNTSVDQFRLLCETLIPQIDASSDEIIFIDNASNNQNELAAAAEKLGVGFLVENKPGSYAARNCGVRAARGRYILFTDDDCSPSEGWVSAMRSAVMKAEALYAGEIKIGCNGGSIGECYDACIAFNQEENVSKGYSTTANLLVPKSYFNDHGLFDDRLFSGGDVEFTKRLVLNGVELKFNQAASITHPARSGREVFRKMRRVTAGHHQKLELKGKNFELQDYLKALYKPVKVLLCKRKVPMIVRMKALVFSFFVSLYRIYLMFNYQFNLENKIPRQ